jgi:hypothetical protein
MSQPIVPVSVPFAEPSLKDLLDMHAKAIMLGLNCHAIATVQSFTAQDATNGRAKLTATMNYSRTYTVQQADGSYVNETRDYPALVDCPAMFLGGGSTVLQMPVAAGDECIIFFNDRDINNWWAGANTGQVASPRLHSFSDGIALVGFGKWKVANATHAMLTNGTAQLGVPTSGGLVRIANLTTTLYTCLSSLITAIEGIKMGPGTYTAGGSPVTGSSGVAVSTTALENARTALQSLLE